MAHRRLPQAIRTGFVGRSIQEMGIGGIVGVQDYVEGFSCKIGQGIPL